MFSHVHFRGSAATSVSFRRVRGVTCALEFDHAVLMDAHGTRFYGLDEVGTRVWELLKAPLTAAELANSLAAEYEAPLHVLLDDTQAFLRRLVDARLVECFITGRK